jgi:phage terminase large subunit-like protein
MAILKSATEEQQRRALSNSTADHLLRFDADFETWAHQNQLPPNGEGWTTWLMMAGRGFGKTRAGAEWIFRLANGKAGVRVALVGATIAEARSIMVEGVSGLLSVARRNRRKLRWEPSSARLLWPKEARRSCSRATVPTGCAGRSTTSPGPTNWRNGGRREKRG